MALTWKIGILGLVHDHVWEHVGTLVSRGDVSLAVADPNKDLRTKARDEFNIHRVHADAIELLDRERPDAVLVFTDNAGAANMVELAAARGIPAMVEKPLASTLADAERMRVAANTAGVPLMVNWPTAWNPAIRSALDLAREGAAGEIYRFSFRGGHGGPKEYGCSPVFYSWLYDRALNGAGAYVDYCGYGASMARLLLGLPSRVQATIGRLQKDYIDVDDNAVLVLRYPRAIGVVEATWTSAGPIPDGGPIIWGSEATLTVQRGYATREGQIVRNGAIRIVTREDPDGRIIEPPALPEGERNATEYFLDRVRSGRPIDGLVSLDVGRDTQEILEAGLLAAREGRDVSLPL